jgi:hypothetical protein
MRGKELADLTAYRDTVENTEKFLTLPDIKP